MIAFPGQVFTPDYKYQPRFPWGQDGTLKIVSYPAGADIPPGVLCQDDGHGLLRVAQDATRLVGVSVFDPDHFDPSVIYNEYDMVPVLRHGSAFVAFQVTLPPYAGPGPLQAARFYPSTGVFSTDTVGTLVNPRIVFSAALRDYYNTSAGSPAMDIPFPVPAVPPGLAAMTFGNYQPGAATQGGTPYPGVTVALVEVNL